jgi:carbon storage regulator
MLVLSRKLGESITVGDNIKITVVAIERGKIRLGISAPDNVTIMREELIQRFEGYTTPDQAAKTPVHVG